MRRFRALVWGLLGTLAFLAVGTSPTQVQPPSDVGESAISVSQATSGRVSITEEKSRGRDGVFGSVVFPVSSAPSARRWASLLPLIAAADFDACPGSHGCEALRGAISSLGDATHSEKLDTVNRAVNRVLRYQEDMENFRELDHWASPRETMERGRGDCEDYAILKMAALRASGVPMDDMFVVVLRDTRRNVHHAVLAVLTPKDYFILDSLNDKVLSDRAVHRYEPLYSVGSRGLWVHGFRQPPAKGPSSEAATN